MRRREFIQLSIGSLVGLQHVPAAPARSPRKISTTDVSTIILNTVDRIREKTNFEQVNFKKTVDELCGSYHDFFEAFHSGFKDFNSVNATLRYISRTTIDMLELLRDSLGLNLSPLEDTLGITIAEDSASTIASKLGNALKKFDGVLRSASSIVPVVGSLFGMVSNGCEYNRFSDKGLENKAEEAKEDCLICAVILLVDLIFIYTGGTYRIAFSGTRKIANSLLWRVRRKIGFDAYSVVLKTVHWLIRGTVENSTSLIAEEIDEGERTLEGVDIDYNESEFIEVGYNKTDVEKLQNQTSDRGWFNDEDSASNVGDDDWSFFVDLPEWGNWKDDKPWWPG